MRPEAEIPEKFPVWYHGRNLPPMTAENVPEIDPTGVPPDPARLVPDLRAAWSDLAAYRLDGKIGGPADGATLGGSEGPFFEDNTRDFPLEGRCKNCSKAVDAHDGLLLCAM